MEEYFYSHGYDNTFKFMNFGMVEPEVRSWNPDDPMNLGIIKPAISSWNPDNFNELIKSHGCKRIEISGKTECIHFMKAKAWVGD